MLCECVCVSTWGCIIRSALSGLSFLLLCWSARGACNVQLPHKSAVHRSVCVHRCVCDGLHVKMHLYFSVSSHTLKHKVWWAHYEIVEPENNYCPSLFFSCIVFVYSWQYWVWSKLQNVHSSSPACQTGKPRNIKVRLLLRLAGGPKRTTRAKTHGVEVQGVYWEQTDQRDNQGQTGQGRWSLRICKQNVRYHTVLGHDSTLSRVKWTRFS